MNTFLLVFDDGNGEDFDVQAFVETLDDGAQCYSMDGHALFIKSNLDVSILTDKFLERAGSNLFFITEVNRAECSGRMVGVFWDFMKEKLPTAA